MKKHTKVKHFLITATAVFICVLCSSMKQNEGMFPLNYLNEKQLRGAGLKLKAKEIYNPNGIALTNALVKIGGCTGSFVSSEGLVITNHHCVYGGVANLSTAENNYLENGFTASNRELELPIDMPIRITQSYEDVSSKVLSGINDNTDAETRAKTIAQNIKQIVTDESAKNNALSYEVSEMFVGKSYTLFRYFMIKDVRLVYAPPASIGQFGGDTDNWEWPRHGGDFSLVRAYIGKDGKSATYSKENIPYKPAKHLKINPKGTKENDFVFIMGYPGRTFRHESAPYMQFQQKLQLPMTQNFYAWYIKKMYDLSEGNEAKRLAFAGEIQSLENVEKNYRGKIQGLQRTNIVQLRLDEDRAMQSMIEKEPDLSKYRELIPKIQKIWQFREEAASKRFYMNWLLNFCNPFYLAQEIVATKEELAKNADPQKENEILNKFKSRVLKNYSIVDKELEKATLAELLTRLIKVDPEMNAVLEGNLPQQYAAEASKTAFFDTSTVLTLLRSNPKSLLSSENTMLQVVEKVYKVYLETESNWQSSELSLKSLMPQYITVREKFKKNQFIPDANSTLRLTYGYIKRYSPNDAEIHMPYTTLQGVLEKANSRADYKMKQQLVDNLRIDNIPSFFKDKRSGKVIVNFLYNLDTTGGNSGSPVLNNKGELIGINFDRSFTATINDYAWNDNYSRSIGCDIRYVIFVMKYIGKADHLLKEMGITLD